MVISLPITRGRAPFFVSLHRATTKLFTASCYAVSFCLCVGFLVPEHPDDYTLQSLEGHHHHYVQIRDAVETDEPLSTQVEDVRVLSCEWNAEIHDTLVFTQYFSSDL